MGKSLLGRGPCKPIADAATVHPSLKAYFGYCLYKAALRLRVQMDEALSHEKLIAPQLGILGVLKDSPPLSQVALGTQMGIDKATIVKLIDDLESRKLVSRHPHPEDRRVNLVQITARGKTVFGDAIKICKKTEDHFLEHLEPSERDALRKIMPKLLR